MDKSSEEQSEQWQSEWMKAVYRLASTLKHLEQENPWPERPLLPQAMDYLMTELWDRCFSQTQIRQAFDLAIANLPTYTAGEEVRP
jgi:hypothetical protein